MTRLAVVKIVVLIGILVTAIFNTATLVYFFLYTDTHSIAVDHPTSSTNNIRIESLSVQSYIHDHPQSRKEAYKTEPEDSHGKQGVVNAMAASIGGALPSDPSSSRQTESASATGTHLSHPPESPAESQHHEVHLQSQSFSVPSHHSLSSTSLPPTTPSPQHPTPATSRPTLQPTLQRVVHEASDLSVVTQARKRGYVVGVSFWDQQTFSTGGIASLQCWAGSKEMLVAEPYMIASFFHAPIEEQYLMSTETKMSLSDMYNFEVWNEGTRRGAPLVRWANFLQEAPRNVVLVDLKPRHRQKCFLDVMKRDYSKFLSENDFTIVREVYFIESKLSLKQFEAKLFASLSPDSVTVIFNEWSYLTAGSIVQLGNCDIGSPLPHLIYPSERALNDTERYIQTYMNGSRSYMALMVRSEWIFMNIGSRPAEQTMSECFAKTLPYWNQTVYAMGLNHTFVTLDIGKYGSKGRRDLISSPLINMATDLLRTVHHNSSLSFSDWEHTFEEASNSTNCGYIGFLQKLVATRAKCLFLIGSGSYQQHALSMYKTLHARKDHCFVTTNTRCNIKMNEGVKINLR